MKVDLTKNYVILGKFNGEYKVIEQYDKFQDMIQVEGEKWNDLVRKENKKRVKKGLPINNKEIIL